MAQNITVTATLNNLISPQLTRIQTQLGALNTQFASVGTASTRATTTSGSGLANLKSGLTSALIPLTAIVTGFGFLAKGILESTNELEQNTVAFTTMLGSAEKATKLLGELKTFADVTPFETTQVNKSAKSLLAFGVAAEDIIATQTKIGDIASGTGKDFNELTLIYGKAKTAGVLMGEDINQLTEAGIPIIAEFANQLGVDESAIKKLASSGQITFDMLETGFTNMTAAGSKFGGLMAAQSQTLGGLFSTLKSQVNSFGTEIGTLFMGDIKSGMESFTALLTTVKPIIVDIITQLKAFKLDLNVDGSTVIINILNGINDNMFRFKAVFDEVKPIVQDFFTSLQNLFGGTNGLDSVFKILAGTLKLMLTPLMVLITVITTISNSIIWLKTKFEELGAIGKALKVILAVMFAPLLIIFGPLIIAIKTIKYFLDNAAESAKKVVDTLVKVDAPSRVLEDRYGRMVTKLAEINTELEGILYTNGLLTEQSKDPFKWMEDKKTIADTSLKLKNLLEQKKNFTTALSEMDTKNPELKAIAGNTSITNDATTKLQGGDTTLSTDRSVTNITLDIAKVIETLSINTENITESTVEITRLVQMALTKALVDATNIKLK